MNKAVVITVGSIAGSLVAIYGAIKLVNPSFSIQYATVPWTIQFVTEYFQDDRTLIQEIYVNDLERDLRHKQRKRCAGDFSAQLKDDINDYYHDIKKYDGEFPEYRGMAQSSICEDLGVTYNGAH